MKASVATAHQPSLTGSHTSARFLYRADAWVRNGSVIFAVLLLAALVADVVYEIVGRTFLPGGGPAWTSEIAGWLLVWVVFVGASLSVHDDAEPAIGLLVDRLKPRAAGLLTQVTDSLAIFTFGFLLFYGMSTARFVAGSIAPASGLSLAYLAAAVPVGAALMLFFKSVKYLRFGWKGLPILATVVGFGVAGLAQVLPLDGSWFYILSLGGLALLLLLGLPIAEALILAAVMSVTLTEPFSSNLAYAQVLSDGLNDFTFVAVPLFLLTGALVAHTGAASRLTAFARSFLGWLPGGLAVADIGASAVFADISGSPVADTVALGSSLIPEMVEEGYPVEFAAGLQAAAGTLGVMFPPSISTLIYASVASVSVSKMFAALLLPGVLVAASFMATSVFICGRQDWGVRIRFRFPNLFFTGIKAAPALFTVVVVLGGIFSGIFTTSEAGAIAAIYILAIALLGYRRQGVPFIVPALTDAIRNAGRVGFIIAAALAYGKTLTANNGPQGLVVGLASVATNKYALIAVLLVGLVFVSTVLEPSTTPLVVIPVLLPILAVAGVDLVHFGVLLQLDAAVALLLPPLGLCLFLVASIAGVRTGKAARWASPFIAALLVDIVLVMFVTPLTTWLPGLVGN